MREIQRGTVSSNSTFQTVLLQQHSANLATLHIERRSLSRTRHDAHFLTSGGLPRAAANADSGSVMRARPPWPRQPDSRTAGQRVRNQETHKNNITQPHHKVAPRRKERESLRQEMMAGQVSFIIVLLVGQPDNRTTRQPDTAARGTDVDSGLRLRPGQNLNPKGWSSQIRGESQ